MVQDDTMVSVLSEFARTLTTDFPIQGILDHLVQRIVDVLPITGAGVTVIAPGSAPRYVAASSTAALSYELLQSELGQGPCLVAYETGETVSAPDLLRDPRFTGFALAAYLLDAQARAQALEVSERHRERSMHDPLTGLPDRSLLQERLEHAAQRAHRSHAHAAVLFVDLDRFKDVNDTHGHRVGDELLVAVARRLKEAVRPGDTLARVAGDEFVVLCEDLADVTDAEALARRIGQAFDRPFPTVGTKVRMTARVGVAYAGPGEAVPDQLITHADLAMYEAKRLGGGTHQLTDLRGASASDGTCVRRGPRGRPGPRPADAAVRRGLADRRAQDDATGGSA